MALTFRKIKDVGVLAFDHDDSKVNVLNFEVIKTLDAMLDEIAQNKSLQALVIVSKKKDIFIAGADIKEIEKITEPKDGQAKAKAGQDVINKIADLDVPTIAVIDGAALGGGCELVLACDYRVATFSDKVKIGLPEVNLGFVPGFGGTYRLPRLIGLSEGIKMILAGQPIDAQKALKIGLVDKLFAQNGLEDSVEAFTAEVIAGKHKNSLPRKKKKGFMGILENTRWGNSIIFSQSRKSVMALSKGFYPAPLKAIEVIKKNFYTNRTKGLDIECQAFGELAVTDISKNLVHLFYLSEKYKKLTVPGAEDIKGVAIEKAGVLGAGIMGGGIAQLLASRDIWARLKDLNYDALALGYKAAYKVFSQAVQRRKLTKAEAERKMAHITGTLDYSGFKNLDIVIEAVLENMNVKKSVFSDLSDACDPKTILASNTSSLSVSEMATAVKDPSKVIGFHFFNPVHRMPLVELITTEDTSTETLVTALNLVKRLGKTPIIVKDSCGFVVNRILLAYINEAGRLLDETGDMIGIDKVMTDFGMPMGPFTLSDEVGLDVGTKVMHILEDAFGERFTASNVFQKITEKKLLGKKSGIGFYIHKKKREPNPDIAAMLKPSTRSLNAHECCDRLIFTMINEAAGCLQDGIVSEADAIDIGMIFGTGFPPFRGGLLKYADTIGVDYVVSSLERFTQDLKAQRFAPSPYLLKLKEQKKGFLSG